MHKGKPGIGLNASQLRKGNTAFLQGCGYRIIQAALLYASASIMKQNLGCMGLQKFPDSFFLTFSEQNPCGCVEIKILHVNILRFCCLTYQLKVLYDDHKP